MDDGADADPALTRECRVLCRYLIGQEPTDYVLGRYVAFHGTARGRDLPSRAFDRFLVHVAMLGGPATSLADAYASRFAVAGALRSKLVLTLALLECTSPSFAVLDVPGRGGPAVVYPLLVARAGLYALQVLVATVLFAPVHLALAARGGTGGRTG